MKRKTYEELLGRLAVIRGEIASEISTKSARTEIETQCLRDAQRSLDVAHDALVDLIQFDDLRNYRYVELKTDGKGNVIGIGKKGV